MRKNKTNEIENDEFFFFWRVTFTLTQPFIRIVMLTGTTVASGETHGHVKFTITCHTLRTLMCGVAKGMVMETLSRHAFTWIRNKCVLSYKFDNGQEEEGEILFQQDGAPSHIRHAVKVP